MCSILSRMETISRSVSHELEPTWSRLESAHHSAQASSFSVADERETFWPLSFCSAFSLLHSVIVLSFLVVGQLLYGQEGKYRRLIGCAWRRCEECRCWRGVWILAYSRECMALEMRKRQLKRGHSLRKVPCGDANTNLLMRSWTHPSRLTETCSRRLQCVTDRLKHIRCECRAPTKAG